MTTKTIKEKKCPLCTNIYEVTYVYDDGVDWLGHARGKVTEVNNDKGCPKCNNDVRAAAKILDQIDEENNKKIELFSKDLKGKYFAKVIYSVNGKKYLYISNDLIQKGVYFVPAKKDKAPFVFIVVAGCFHIQKNEEGKVVSVDSFSKLESDELSMEDLEGLTKVKQFTGRLIKNEHLKELTLEAVRQIEEDNIDQALELLKMSKYYQEGANNLSKMFRFCEISSDHLEIWDKIING